LNPFDYSKPVADFWTAQGEVFLKAQQQVGKALADGVQAAASGNSQSCQTRQLTPMPVSQIWRPPASR
jgi:hypothetical protein